MKLPLEIPFFQIFQYIQTTTSLFAMGYTDVGFARNN